MRISKWGSILAIFVVVLGGIAIAAPLAIEASIKSFITEIRSTLPDGSSFAYEGLEYKPLKDELYFDKVQIGWTDSQDNGKLDYADGEITFHKLTLSENNTGVESWISSDSAERRSTNYTVTWEKIDLNIIDPEFGFVGSKGEASGVILPDLTSLKGLSIAEIITNHLSIADASIEGTVLSYQKTLTDVGPANVNGQTDKIMVKNYSVGVLAELQIDGFFIETAVVNKLGDKIDFEVKSEYNKFSDLNILPIFKKRVVKRYDYADLWQSDLETFEDYKAMLIEFDAAKSDLSEFGEVHSKGIELGFLYRDLGMSIVVDEAIMHESNELIADGISIRKIEAIVTFINEPDEEIKTSIEELYSKRIDISELPIHFEEILRAGSLAMEQRIQRDGFLSVIPSMYFEEIGAKNAYIDIKGKKNDTVEFKEFKVFDISIDDENNRSFGINVDGIATKKKTVKALAPDLYALLGAIQGDHVLLSANLDVDQLTSRNQINLNDFSLDIEELGGVSFKVGLGNLNVNNLETFDPMGGNINSLAFHIKDRGVVEAGKLILALTQEWPVEQADGLIVGIVSSQRRDGQSARTDKFFNSLESILTSAGDFNVKGDPKNPIEFINVMGLLGASDIDGLVNKLELESEYNPLSAN